MAEGRLRADIAQLVAEHHQAVYRYAFRLCGNQADAEDLTQQVFLTVQRKVGQLRSADRARAWLFTILRNCFLRTKQRQRPVPVSDLKLNVDTIPMEVDDEQIDRERLQQALSDLPDNFRLVVLMFYYEDRSYREIAEELDLPIGTVMSRLARAKGHLRSRLFEPPLPEPRSAAEIEAVQPAGRPRK